MRIAFDATPLRPGKSGIGYHVENLIRALAGTGELEEIILFSNREPVFDGTPPPGVRWPRRHLFLKRAVWMQGLLPRLIREEKPDLTHFPNFNAPVIGCRPFVVTFHDTVVLRHPQFFTWKKRCLTRSLMPVTARRADAILTVSETVRGEIIEALGVPEERVHVVSHAPGDHFRPVSDAAARITILERHGVSRPYILFVGTLEPRKNLAGLLRAFDLLKRETRLPHCLLVIGGRGWKTAAIDSTLAAIEQTDSVQLLDYVPLEDLPALYTSADLLVFPSFYEGFGAPPLEAMRCGTPTVVSDIPVLHEVAGDAAIFVDPHDPGSIAEAMRSVLVDAALAERLRARGFERGNLYSWDRSAREALAVYRAVLERRKGSPVQVRPS